MTPAYWRWSVWLRLHRLRIRIFGESADERRARLINMATYRYWREQHRRGR